MSVVSLSEVAGYSAHRNLLNDINDANKLMESINSFIDNSSNLKGTGYDLMRSNLINHVNVSSKRISAANELYTSICDALSFMEEYISPYDVLDDSLIDEVKKTIGQLCNEADDLYSKTYSKITVPKVLGNGEYVRDEEGNVIYHTVNAFSQSEIDSFLKRIKKIQEEDIPYMMILLEKLNGLEGAIATALGKVSSNNIGLI